MQTKIDTGIPDSPECVRNHLGIYACEPQTLGKLHAMLLAHELPACSAEEMEERRNEKPALEVTPEGIAVIPVHGVMQRGDSKFNDVTNTLKLRKLFREAAARPDVAGVMLHIDSPGGTVAGQTELVDELARLSAVKPVRSFVDEMACSAAYWLAASTGQITANRLAEVANIGCYTVAYDETGRLDRMGVRIVTVSSGQYKGLGADGSVPDELVEEMTRRVKTVNAEFTRAVSEGRGLELAAVEALADGRCWSGAEALERGLIDAVGNFEDAMNSFTQTINEGKERKMAEENKVLDEFKALVERDGYEFAKENFGKPEGEIELARRDVKIAKLEAEKAATLSELAVKSEELSKANARISELEKELAESKSATARGAKAAGFQERPDETKQPRHARMQGKSNNQ